MTDDIRTIYKCKVLPHPLKSDDYEMVFMHDTSYGVECGCIVGSTYIHDRPHAKCYGFLPTLEL